jgi:hypothetical protein
VTVHFSCAAQQQQHLAVQHCSCTVHSPVQHSILGCCLLFGGCCWNTRRICLWALAGSASFPLLTSWWQGLRRLAHKNNRCVQLKQASELAVCLSLPSFLQGSWAVRWLSACTAPGYVCCDGAGALVGERFSWLPCSVLVLFAMCHCMAAAAL